MRETIVQATRREAADELEAKLATLGDVPAEQVAPAIAEAAQVLRDLQED